MIIVTCQNWVQSPTRTFVESLICVSLVISYIPQYLTVVRHGTFGISSWFILYTTLFSITQFASRLSNSWAKFAFTCLNSGELRGYQAFSAILGFIQAAIQWLCAIILMILYLKYRTSFDQELLDRQGGFISRPISSPRLKTIVVTYNMIFLSTGLIILWRPDWIEDHFNREFWSRIFELVLNWLWTWILIVVVIFQYIPQITTTWQLRTSGSINLWSLGLQIVAFLALGVAQAFRLGIPSQESSQPARSTMQLYFAVGKLSINYLISALGQLVLLVVSLYVDWGNLRRGEALYNLF